MTETTDAGAVVSLETISCELRLREVYERVEVE